MAPPFPKAPRYRPARTAPPSSPCPTARGCASHQPPKCGWSGCAPTTANVIWTPASCSGTAASSPNPRASAAARSTSGRLRATPPCAARTSACMPKASAAPWKCCAAGWLPATASPRPTWTPARAPGSPPRASPSWPSCCPPPIWAASRAAPGRRPPRACHCLPLRAMRRPTTWRSPPDPTSAPCCWTPVPGNPASCFRRDRTARTMCASAPSRARASRAMSAPPRCRSWPVRSRPGCSRSLTRCRSTTGLSDSGGWTHPIRPTRPLRAA